MTSKHTIPIFGLLCLLCAAGTASAIDQEGCLNCHQYRGLARIDEDGKSVRNFSVDPTYYNRGLGPHARMKCTDCHVAAEVSVFPHQKTTPVDCARTCHLGEGGQREVRFSHQNVRQMLGESVHGAETMRRSNEILGRPLREGQADCLLCHDEPSFTNSPMKWAQEEAPVGRCNVCHNEELPRNTQFSFWHVHARSMPARSNQEVVKVCGMCHSNREIQRAFGLPDAAASYLSSFHGKAVLLGSKEAAGCIDCHVAPLQNVHVMKAHKDPESSTHPAQVADTCRSATCHPTAGARISTAAIHLNLPTSRGIEFLIACVFVFLIATTFGPSLMLTLLKLLQIVVGRTDPQHEHHLHVARQLMEHPEGRRKLERFTPHQRVQHWLLFACFTALCLTGFPIKFADRPWAAWLVNLLGGVSAARLAHRWAGVTLLLGFTYHMIYIVIHVIREKRRTGRSLFRIVWDLPMFVRPSDAMDMLNLTLYVLFLRKKRPEFGRFSPEEKFEYLGVFWGSILLGLTGILMWANAWASRYIPGRILTIAMLLHTFEAFLALLHVGIVHMASVLLAPGVFPISPAMFTGRTPDEELVEAHGALLAEVEEQVLRQPEGSLISEGTHHG